LKRAAHNQLLRDASRTHDQCRDTYRAGYARWEGEIGLIAEEHSWLELAGAPVYDGYVVAWQTCLTECVPESTGQPN
jgi:hypothetical protein